MHGWWFLLPTVLLAQSLIHQWTFNDGTANDSVGGANGVLKGSATIRNGALFFDNSGNTKNVIAKGNYMRAVLPQEIKAKTLVVWVTLDANQLQQPGGGGALSLDKHTDFDAIVYGEQTRYQWQAGSGLFRRSPANNGGASETSTTEVMIATVYANDNSVTIYRNGVLYATHTIGTLQTFPGTASSPRPSLALIGLRHATGCPRNCFLTGSVNEARIYNGPLTFTQIQALVPTLPTLAPTTAALTAAPTLAPPLPGTPCNSLCPCISGWTQHYQYGLYTSAASLGEYNNPDPVSVAAICDQTPGCVGFGMGLPSCCPGAAHLKAAGGTLLPDGNWCSYVRN